MCSLFGKVGLLFIVLFWLFLFKHYRNPDSYPVEFLKMLSPISTLDCAVQCYVGKMKGNSMSAVGTFKSFSDRSCRSSDMIHFSASTPFVHPPEEEVSQFDLF